MYVPSHFEESRKDVLCELIKSYPLGTIIVSRKMQIEANHIPFLVSRSAEDDSILLRGHVAKSNPTWRDVDLNTQVLVIFHGPNSYISPNWYATKLEHGRAVPTWNYITIHAHGKLLIEHDSNWLLDQVSRLTDHMESTQINQWSVSDAPREYIERMLKSIVGIEIKVEKLIGKWKVSQNQTDENRQSVVQALENSSNSNDQIMAQWVRRFLDEKQ